jgi:hypothetical protein
MIQSRLPLVLTGAALALALAACDRGTADGAAGSAAPSTEAPAADATQPALPTTTTPPLSVTAVDVGSAIGTDDRVTTAATMFDRDDTVYISVATDGSADNVPVTAKWMFQDGQVIDTETRVVEHAGPAVTAFRVSRPDGWPSGQYQVQVSVADRVLQTREFTVR